MSQQFPIDWTDNRTTEWSHATGVYTERVATHRCLSTAITVMALSIAVFVVSACNTLSGAGKDLHSAGGAAAGTNGKTAD